MRLDALLAGSWRGNDLFRRSSERSRMSAWFEFGCRRSARHSLSDGGRRIRKSKASLGWMWARGAPRYTRVCASAGSPQAAQDRRRVLRTKFETLEA